MTVARRVSTRHGSTYNPLTAITWAAAFWADDPSWSNPGNGNAVSSWRDGTGGTNHAVQATGTKQPLFRSSVTALNNRGGVEFDGVNDILVAPISSIAQPYSMVVISQFVANTDNTYVMTTAASGASPGIRQVNSSGFVFGLYAGTAYNSTAAADTNGFLVTGYFNGASSVVTKDGTAAASGAAGATATGTTLNLAAFGSTSPTAFSNQRLAFVGLISGNVTTNGAWTQFKSDTATYYGLTIA